MKELFLTMPYEEDWQTKEAFKTLRTNLLFCGSDIKAVGITSCDENEGKSTISMGLCTNLAQIGKKVVLVDCDLRKSVLASRYRIEDEIVGLSHYLSGQATREEVIYKTNVEHMDMILAGIVPPNPTELLGHPRFAELIAELKEIYDYVILDTPPLGKVVDGAVVAPVADGVAVVVAANVTSRKFVERILTQLDRTGAKFLGIVVNMVSRKSSKYGYGYSYGYGYGHTPEEHEFKGI